MTPTNPESTTTAPSAAKSLQGLASWLRREADSPAPFQRAKNEQFLRWASAVEALEAAASPAPAAARRALEALYAKRDYVTDERDLKLCDAAIADLRRELGEKT